MNPFSKISSKIGSIVYELEVFGVDKEAGTADAHRLYEYEIDGIKFYMNKKMPSGIRLPVGKSHWTKKFYPVSGSLMKELQEDADDDDSESK